MNKPLASNYQFIQDNRAKNEFLVRRAAFTSPDILQMEKEKIFSKCWLYLGHASEIRNKYDFFTRKVGGRKWICTRDQDNQIRAFYNTCTHRGALVCRERHGNNKFFVCGYHGWTFDSRGTHVDQPGTSGYPDGFFESGAKNLFQAPRLEIYRDFIFINIDTEAESLDEFLGPGGKQIIDYAADQGPNGMEIVAGTQEYSMRANWKLLVENSADGYHGVPTHATYFDYLMASPMNLRPDAKLDLTNNPAFDLGNGHAMIQTSAPWARPVAQWCPRRGESGRADVEKVRKELDDRLGKERASVVAELNRNMLIFPNLVINDIMSLTIRTFDPVDPGYIEIRAWSLGPIGEPEGIRAHRLYDFIDFLGPAGFATPDDVEMLELCQQGYQNMGEVEWNDISKGMNKEQCHVDDELQMRAFWREWNRRMTA